MSNLLSSGSVEEEIEGYFRKIVPIREIFARLARNPGRVRAGFFGIML